MTASRAVPFVAAMTGVVDGDGDVFAPGAFRAGLAARQPRIVGGHDWQQPLGRVVDLVELRPGDPRLPKRTTDGRRWPRAAGALVGGAVYNLATKGGADAFEVAAAGRGPHSLTLGFRASRTSRRGRVRVIDAAEVFTLAPAGAALSRKDAGMMTFETKAAPGSRGSRPPWETGKRSGAGADDDTSRRPPGQRPPHPLEPGKVSADEVDDFHDVEDDLSLAMSPPGMATLRCSLCSRDFGWADAGPAMAVCEDCARQSAQARVRRGADRDGATAGRDRESAASEQVRATFPKRPSPGAPGSDAAGDPRYSTRPDGQLDREDTPSKRRRGAPAPGMAGRVG